MTDPEELISIYRATHLTEAHLIKNLLLEDEIDATVGEENEPLAGLTIVQSDVLVHRKDEARARAIIAVYEEQQIARAERPDWKCPKCGVNVVGAFDICDACGADRPGYEEEDDGGESE